jgi:molecular chaperone GrpE
MIDSEELPESGADSANSYPEPELGTVSASGSDADVGEGVAAEPEAERDPEVLAAQVATLTAQLAEREDAVLRIKAEADNMRKRAQRDIDNARKFALEPFVGELLPVKDSVELGIAACDSDSASLESVREGAMLTEKMLSAALEKFGVVVVDPLGERFNPEQHQAVSMVPAEGVESGQVMTVIQKGYVLNDRLVRPAMVMVAQ